MSELFRSVSNGARLPLREIPVLSFEAFQETMIRHIQSGARLIQFFARPYSETHLQLFAVLADPRDGLLTVGATTIGDTYPSLTPDCPPAHWFEREIAEQWGVVPRGHPWLKPIRFHPSYRPGHDAWQRNEDVPIVAGDTSFFGMRGEELHEVAVGPVHAGIIEPGHFRFQCHGEQVFHLEISLGYQHRGIEQRLIGGPDRRAMHYMETAAGDATIAHALAYAHAMEALAGTEAPVRAQALRGIALELERLANHTGDLGALAGDVGYLPTASFCGRIRGDFLNLTARLCGNRFGRGLVRPGGTAFDGEESRIEDLLRGLDAARRDVTTAVNLLWITPTVLARFEDTGVVTRETCEELGLVGPAARACGIERDVRFEFPAGIYCFAQIPVSVWHSGDVFARAYVRWLEIQRSLAFVEEQLRMLPAGPVTAPLAALAPDSFAATLVEGWRGEVCHAAIADSAGRLAHYKMVDPSFHNWMGLAMALRNQPISDFPLCNKSFNLSYCGHDL